MYMWKMKGEAAAVFPEKLAIQGAVMLYFAVRRVVPITAATKSCSQTSSSMKTNLVGRSNGAELDVRVDHSGRAVGQVSRRHLFVEGLSRKLTQLKTRCQRGHRW